MASIINASSTGSGGIVQTADASGVLQLQSNGTTALTVSGSAVTFASQPAGTFAGTGPAFSAYASASQVPTTSTNTKININTEFFDTASCFNTSTNSFTPNVAGYYMVRGCIRFSINSATSATNGLSMIILFKNGSEFYRGTELRIANNAPQQIEICTIVYMNGTTDYIDLYGRLDGTGLLFEYGGSSAYTSQFSAALVRAA
jgi:hypothetical protein